MTPDRQLLLDASAALRSSERALREPQMLYHRNVENALRQAQIAVAKLNVLEAQLRGVPNPKSGD